MEYTTPLNSLLLYYPEAMHSQMEHQSLYPSRSRYNHKKYTILLYHSTRALLSLLIHPTLGFQPSIIDYDWHLGLDSSAASLPMQKVQASQTYEYSQFNICIAVLPWSIQSVLSFHSSICMYTTKLEFVQKSNTVSKFCPLKYNLQALIHYDLDTFVREFHFKSRISAFHFCLLGTQSACSFHFWHTHYYYVHTEYLSATIHTQVADPSRVYHPDDLPTSPRA